MTQTTEPQHRCPFPCIYDSYPAHTEHAWTDATTAQVAGKPGTTYCYVVTDNSSSRGTEILVGITEDGDESGGGEAWMTVSQAAHLRDTLTQALEFAEAAS